MAVSPLAQIDWNNLEGEDSNTVMNLLQRAFNERLVVSRINLSTGIGNTGFFPFPDGSPTNTPTWGMPGTPSLWNWTNWPGQTNPVMDSLCRNFADMTYINANLNTVIPKMGNYAQESNINLSKTKVLNYIGIADWPRVINPNATELKQWYDILKLFTHVFTVENSIGTSEGSKNAIGGTFISSAFSGIYDDIGASEPRDRTYFQSGSPDLTDLSNDWAQLYAGPEAKTIFSNDTPVSGIYVQATRFATSYDIIGLKLYFTINNQGLTDTGYTRTPLETKCWGQWVVNIDSAVTGVRDPVATAAYLAANNIVDLELTEFGGSSVRSAAEVEYSSTDTPLTLPIYNDQISFNIKKIMKFFDNWNDPTGNTGFEFYTP